MSRGAWPFLFGHRTVHIVIVAATYVEVEKGAYGPMVLCVIGIGIGIGSSLSSLFVGVGTGTVLRCVRGCEQGLLLCVP